MQRTKEQELEYESRLAFRSLLPPSWIVRDIEPDVGIDLTIEIVDDGKVTNKVLWVQVKGTNKDIARDKKAKKSIETKHLHYYEDSRSPIIIILGVKRSGKFDFYYAFAQQYIREILSVKNPKWREQGENTIGFDKLNIDDLDDIAFNGYYYIFQTQLGTDNKGALYWQGELPKSDDKTVRENIIQALIYCLGEEYEKGVEELNNILRLYTLSPSDKLSTLIPLANCYSIIAKYEEAKGIYNTIIKVADKAEGSVKVNSKAIGYGGIGITNSFLGNYEAGLDNLKKALKINTAEGNKHGVLSNLNNIGNIYRITGNPKESLSYFQQALEIAEEINEDVNIATIHNNIGNIHMNAYNFDGAIESYKKALEIFEKIDSARGVASVYGNIGVLFRYNYEFDKAYSYYSKCLEIYTQLGLVKEEALSLFQIGELYNDFDQLPQALEYLNKALEILKNIKFQEGIADTLGSIGGVYIKKLDFQVAFNYLNDSLELNRSIGNKKGIADNLYNIGIAYFKSDKYESAAVHFNESLETYSDNLQLEALCYFHLGYIQYHDGNKKEAIGYLNKAKDIAEQIYFHELSENARSLISHILLNPDNYR